MLDLRTKLKRQIEILGVAVHNPDHLRDLDLAVMFGRDIPTIKRDMQELRRQGLDVHSTKKRGICVTGTIDPKTLREYIMMYMGLSNAAHGVDRATSLMIKKLKEKSLSNVVRLQQCIENRTTALIDYQKEAGSIERTREIWPLLLFNSEGYWRVLASNEGKLKQYHLNKIIGVKDSGRKFRRPAQQEIDDIFRYSFKSWIGTERHRIKIKLASVWAERLKPQVMMETEVMAEEPDGSVVLEGTVNSLDEVAGWVVSRGKGVEVIDPPALRTKVVALARATLSNYRA
jgi:predicted DNA-binding transcriptional regulator YafY